MSELDKIKSERSRIRRSFTNVGKKIDGLLEKEERTDAETVELSSLMELLTLRNDELNDKNELVLTTLGMDQAKDKEFNIEQDKIDEYHLSFLKYKTAVGQVVNHSPEFETKSVGVLSSNGSESQKRTKYKLPVLQLKRFGGDLKDWLPFWSQFSKFDEDENIDDVDKLGYLTQCMVEYSPARELVDSYPATGKMYSSVVKALKERYGRDDLLTEFYIRELLKLIIQNTNSQNQLGVSVLYDRLQCHLRNLEVLGVTAENCAPILMPLVSSCLPEEMLKTWERNCSPNVKRANPDATSKDFLDNIMLFLRTEVEGEQKVEMARTGFGLSDESRGNQNKTSSRKREIKMPNHKASVPTATGLLTTTKTPGSQACIFCNLNHNPQDCKSALDMSLERRREKVASARVCFCCLKGSHIASRCKNRPKCIVCKRGHFVLMCDQVRHDEKAFDATTKKPNKSGTSVSKDEALATVQNCCNILMQTLLVTVRGSNGCTRTARLLIDTASHRSYMTAAVATDMGYAACRQELVQHSLFGGVMTEVVTHNVYRLYLSKLDETYHCNFEVLEQGKICGTISPVIDGPWIHELTAHNIELSDTGAATEIQILVGADIAAKLWTGNRIVLSSGLVAMETTLGWTLSGKVPDSGMKGPASRQESLATVVTTMLSREAMITDLWTLDTLGITDPSNKVSKAETELAVQQHFRDNVSVTESGRFEVHLPWVANSPPLPDNYQLALKRLQATVKKLKAEGYYYAYDELLDEWLREDVIEEVPLDEMDFPCHYLPHRHVIKLNSTTPVRPVFDASAKENKNLSLNQCLEKGPNLIEKITSVLARFRLNEVAVVGDIRRAFLQINVCAKDRNFLRFLWFDRNGTLKTYRHRRVVFGVSPSPFLLESCIKFHLENTLALCEDGRLDWPVSFIEQLANSFYVDNCLTSLENEQQAQEFINIATQVMAERKFELRGWELSGETTAPAPANVLGLLWYKEEDVLALNLDSLKSIRTEKITKKVMLSAAHRIFDPIGVFCCVVLIPKLLIQQTWELGLTWEQEVGEDLRKKFLEWYEDMEKLSEVRVPRWVSISNKPNENWTLHVFSDACQTSYAAVVFLRVEHKGAVSVQLLAAKSRVAPTAKSNKGLTIPRLELLAALIGARLYSSVVSDYNLPNTKTIFWTDATTVLAWIQRSEPWDIFVMNRIREIRELTNSCEWRHTPGTLNPADLPSRGCSPTKFVKSRWWEGPDWLREPEEFWPQNRVVFNEDEIDIEKKKSVVSSMVCSTKNDSWYYKRFSHYKMVVRTVGWILRFWKNTKIKKELRPHQDLTAEEYTLAEQKVLVLVQEDLFNGIFDTKLSSLLPFIDDQGLIRIMTKISYRADVKDFCHPIVLSTDHPVVQRLIMDVHLQNCHAGVHMLVSILRQQFWILGGRQAVRKVISTCVRCKRFAAKRIESKPIPLPEPRVRNAKVFEVCGVDLAGPLYLSGSGSKEKVYICLFTCAVYRAVHLELLSSQSTDSFILGFRRFISRRGRPSTMFSDQGSNFVGLENALKRLDWGEITRFSSVRKIDWRFTPPSSPWWGGWWERLIGVLKRLLRRVLGRASLEYDELQTILCDCEAVINSRPITYLSDSPEDLTPLAPQMFLHDIEEVGIPDLTLVEAKDLRKRHQHRQKLTEILRERFRDEYLGQLKLASSQKNDMSVLPGDIVLIGDDKTTRLDWPMGRVTDVIEGADGNCRVVKLKTALGELTRSVQRLYPLELDLQHGKDESVTDHLRGVLQQKRVVAPDYAPEVNEDTTSQSASFKVSAPVEDDGSMLTEGTVQNNNQQPSATATRRGRMVKKPKRLNL